VCPKADVDLGRLEAAKKLVLFGRKWHIACDVFCATMKCSVKPSTSEPNKPKGEIGETRKAVNILDLC